MNIATTVPAPNLVAPNLAAPNVEMIAGLSQNNLAAIDFAAVFAAAGLGAITAETMGSLGQDAGQSPADEAQTDSLLNLEQAIQMMAAQTGLLVQVQSAAQDQTVLPTQQAANGTAVGTVSEAASAPIQSLQKSGVDLPIAAATTENTVPADMQPMQKTGKSSQSKAAEQLQSNLKTADNKTTQELTNTDPRNIDSTTLVNNQNAAETATATTQVAAASDVNQAVSAVVSGYLLPLRNQTRLKRQPMHKLSAERVLVFQMSNQKPKSNRSKLRKRRHRGISPMPNKMKNRLSPDRQSGPVPGRMPNLLITAIQQ